MKDQFFYDPLFRQRVKISAQGQYSGHLQLWDSGLNAWLVYEKVTPAILAELQRRHMKPVVVNPCKK